MTPVHKYWVCRQPMVAWYVGGRKLFGPHSPIIRAMWKVGDYRRIQHGRRTPETKP